MNTPTVGAQSGADLDLSTGDIAFTPYGDLALCAGEALLEQRIFRRLVTTFLLNNPTYGAGIGAWVGQPITPAAQAQIAAQIATQVILEPLVASVSAVTFSLPTPNTLQIDFSVVTTQGASVPIGITLNPSGAVLTGGAVSTS